VWAEIDRLESETQRLHREEGLTVRKRKGRKRDAGSRAPILIEVRPNARWSVDFVHDQLSDGRRFRILNVIDNITKECLAVIAQTSISWRRVARELVAWRGRPDLIVSDHGTEFTSNAMLAWSQEIRLWHQRNVQMNSQRSLGVVTGGPRHIRAHTAKSSTAQARCLRSIGRNYSRTGHQQAQTAAKLTTFVTGIRSSKKRTPFCGKNSTPAFRNTLSIKAIESWFPA
jgi:hypothetical protein